MFLLVKWENVRRQGNKTESKWVNEVMQTLKIKMQVFNIKKHGLEYYGAWVWLHMVQNFPSTLTHSNPFQIEFQPRWPVTHLYLPVSLFFLRLSAGWIGSWVYVQP